MGRYRKIDPRIHNDAKILALSERGQRLFMTILTHPHMTALGAMRATEVGLCTELAQGFTENQDEIEVLGKAFGKDFQEGFGEGYPEVLAEAYRVSFRQAIKIGLFKFDSRASCLIVPNFLKYNEAENPNVVIAWFKALDLIPECHIRDELITHLVDYLREKSDKFTSTLDKAFTKAFGKGFKEAFKEAMGDTFGDTFGKTGAGAGAGINYPPKAPPRGGGPGKDKKRRKKESPPLPPYSPEFESFWTHYPNKKGGKDEAWQRWERKRKAGKLPPLDYLLKAVEQLKESPDWLKDDGAFIPMVTTWLNKGRWTDVDGLKSNAADTKGRPDPDCPYCDGKGLEPKDEAGKTWGPCRCRKKEE